MSKREKATDQLYELLSSAQNGYYPQYDAVKLTIDSIIDAVLEEPKTPEEEINGCLPHCSCRDCWE